jgi:similar to stage IV sporulation protein
MKISGFARYSAGFLTIRVEGLYLEKFLNMSVTSGINFWDIKRLGMTVMELKLSAGSYKRLKKILNRTGCKVTIKEKNGLPFSIMKIKKRMMLGIGFVIFIFLVFMLSSFIWSVNITGVRTVNAEEIEKNHSDLGIKPGTFKPGIDVSRIENEMLIRMDSISWIKVKLVGTRAEIEVAERVTPPEIVSDDKPCNIVAKRDGIIDKIIAAKGDVLVTPGDPVKKGQKLVSGVIERPNADTRYVHSSAQVTARTWYEKTVGIPLEKVEKVRTGNKKTAVFIQIGSREYPIRNPGIPYKDYDKTGRSIKLVNTEKFQLPLKITFYEYYETAGSTAILTEEQAKAKAVDEVEKVIIDNIPPDAKIINKKVNVSIKNKIAVASALVETIEDIGIQEEIE